MANSVMLALAISAVMLQTIMAFSWGSLLPTTGKRQLAVSLRCILVQSHASHQVTKYSIAERLSHWTHKWG